MSEATVMQLLWERLRDGAAQRRLGFTSTVNLAVVYVKFPATPPTVIVQVTFPRGDRFVVTRYLPGDGKRSWTFELADPRFCLDRLLALVWRVLPPSAEQLLEAGQEDGLDAVEEVLVQVAEALDPGVDVARQAHGDLLGVPVERARVKPCVLPPFALAAGVSGAWDDHIGVSVTTLQFGGQLGEERRSHAPDGNQL